MVEPVDSDRSIGLRQVAVVAVVVVAAVLGLAVLSALIPGLGGAFDRLPIAIGILLAGTAWVLWQIIRPSHR